MGVPFEQIHELRSRRGVEGFQAGAESLSDFAGVRMHFGDGLEETVDAAAGDFIYVPPNTVHVEENVSATDPAELIVARNTAEYLVVNVDDPRA